MKAIPSPLSSVPRCVLSLPSLHVRSTAAQTNIRICDAVVRVDERSSTVAQPTSLKHGTVATRIPVQDLDRARRFYAEKLGLTPVEKRPGGLRYTCASGEFVLF